MIEALSYLLATFLGILAGIFTGLTPGIHINLIAALALSIKFYDPFFLACFIVAMSITHTFLDFIPSVLIGLPDDDTALSLLPGHRLLIKGLGFAAIKLTIVGSFYGFLLALAVIPLYIKIINFAWMHIKHYIPYFLIFVSLLLILKEKNKLLSFLVFLLSGILGILTLNFKAINQPLLPLFTGLFGLPMLLLSIKNKVKIKNQRLSEIKLKRKEKIKSLAAGLFSSSLVSFFPALGPGQAAILGSDMFGKLSTKEFLVLLGSINTIVMLFSFVSAYAISKPRTGTAVTVLQILGKIDFNVLLLLLTVAFISACISVLIGIKISKFLVKRISKINYSLLCFIAFLFIIIVNIFVSGLYSLFVVATGLFIGLIPNLKNIRRVHLMGCLVLPVLGFYF